MEELEDRDEAEEGVSTGGSLRTVMATFPTGVTVVATRDGDRGPVGLTVNSFTSVSLEPPLVLVCIDHEARSHDPILSARGFTVSVLAATQAEVAVRFASGPSQGRFDDVEWSSAPSGHPVIEGATAWLDCELERVIEAGDHSILLARTTAYGWGDEPALLFHRGIMGSTDE